MSHPYSLCEKIRRWRDDDPHAEAYVRLYMSDTGACELETCTWVELDMRVRALARRLAQTCERQDRVIIALPQILDYPVAFFACLRVGLVAVPLPEPSTPAHQQRLAAAMSDCSPAVVLTTSSDAQKVQGACGDAGVTVMTVDGDDGNTPPPAAPVSLSPDDAAYLQYTSGSTSSPAGVVVTHGALERNLQQIVERFAPTRECTAVSWLPFYHDMGLVNGLLMSTYLGCRAVFMDPLLFLKDPSIWMRCLEKYPHAYSAAPNFAFDLCVRKVRPEQLTGLDFSGVHGVVVGSEPISPAVMTIFEERFSDYGWRTDALMPSYGLAENVVLVSGDRGVRTYSVDAAAMRRDRVVSAQPGNPSLSLVGCGRPVEGLTICIVDPHEGVPSPHGHIGEIWCHDPEAPQRYWSALEREDGVFGGRLVNSGDFPDGPWLRTGDLGAFIDGELVVTGRLKDLIIIDGVNHYPSDIERTVESSDRIFRPGRSAAFSVSDDLGQEARVVVVAEVRATDRDETSLVSDVRAAVMRDHQVPLHDLVLVAAGTLPLTTSGKVRRRATRDSYLAERAAKGDIR